MSMILYLVFCAAAAVSMSMKANYAFLANDREKELTHDTYMSDNMSKLLNGFPIPYISIYGKKEDARVSALIGKMNVCLFVFYTSLVGLCVLAFCFQAK